MLALFVCVCEAPVASKCKTSFRVIPLFSVRIDQLGLIHSPPTAGLLFSSVGFTIMVLVVATRNTSRCFIFLIATMTNSLRSIGLGILAPALVATAVDARTTVAVVEIGQGGAVRRTTAASPHATVSGISSFWSALHDGVGGRTRRGAQHPGMAIVPDLFSRPDGGLALGVIGSGVDLADMPHLSNLLSKEAVGTFELAGSQAHNLLKKAAKGKKAAVENDLSNAADVVSSLKTKAAAAVNNKLESLTVSVENEESAADVDSSIASVIKSLQKQSSDTGKTMVLHLVIDEEESGATRRRLEDQQQEDEEEEEAEEEEEEADEDENNQNGDGNNNNNNQKQYSDSSEYERTIFQIQYFNVVLWSAVGLVIILVTAIYMMMYMPLMADTLLFGESAKMVGE